jgi:hypothetical protein
VVDVFVRSVGSLETTLGSWGEPSVVLGYSHICSCNLSSDGRIPTSTLVHLDKSGVVLRSGLLCIVRDVRAAALHETTLTLAGQLGVVSPNLALHEHETTLTLAGQLGVVSPNLALHEHETTLTLAGQLGVVSPNFR